LNKQILNIETKVSSQPVQELEDNTSEQNSLVNEEDNEMEMLRK